MKYLLFLFLLIASRSSFAQMNLVPNPSFEDTVYCPFGTNQIDACANWLNFGNSPDYFNTCSNPAFAVPNSIFGYQYPHSGNAYAGAVFYARPNVPGGPNYRESIGVELSTTLIVGQKYFFSFHLVNAGVNNGSIACNKQGVNFYTLPFDSCCPPPINNNSLYFNDTILIDTLNWTKISGSFIADSAYRFLCISNFFDDTNTDTIITSPFSIPYAAYYYIDDVCVTTDSLYNFTWTGIKESIYPSTPVRIYPNPTTDKLILEAQHPISNYRLFNLLGNVILENNLSSSNIIIIDLLNVPEGVYVIQVNINNSLQNKKIILTHKTN